MNSELNELAADIREQVLYLQELGVETLDARLSAIQTVDGRQEIGEGQVVSSREAIPAAPPPKTERPVAGSRLASLPTLSDLRSGNFFDKYNPRETADTSEVSGKAELPKEPASDALFEIAPTLTETADTIESIRAEIGPACTRCKLSTLGRSRVVNSVGSFNTDLMFVGEAPGGDEDRLGEPFVGRAGQLLTDIIRAIGMERSDCFIGNINRCRPPGNRAPEPDESEVCKPFLLREIAVVRPKVIVVLGATAAQNLLETKTPISKMRGHFHDYLGVKVMPTFHPAYLLRDPHKKREVWEDMKMVRDYLKEVTTR